MKQSACDESLPSDLVPLCSVENLKDDDVERVEVTGYAPIAVFRLNGEYYAIDDTCTHGNASLADGLVEDGEIECPFHGGRFEIRTGKATAHPCTKPITVYPIVIDQGRVCARLAPLPNIRGD